MRTAATQCCSHQWSCWSCAFVVDGGVLSDVVQQSRENHSSSTYLTLGSAPPSGLTNQLSPQSKQTPVVKTNHQTLVSLLCRMFCTHFELADIQGKKCSVVNESRFSAAATVGPHSSDSEGSTECRLSTSLAFSAALTPSLPPPLFSQGAERSGRRLQSNTCRAAGRVTSSGSSLTSATMWAHRAQK